MKVSCDRKVYLVVDGNLSRPVIVFLFSFCCCLFCNYIEYLMKTNTAITRRRYHSFHIIVGHGALNLSGPEKKKRAHFMLCTSFCGALSELFSHCNVCLIMSDLKKIYNVDYNVYNLPRLKGIN